MSRAIAGEIGLVEIADGVRAVLPRGVSAFEVLPIDDYCIALRVLAAANS